MWRRRDGGRLRTTARRSSRTSGAPSPWTTPARRRRRPWRTPFSGAGATTPRTRCGASTRGRRAAAIRGAPPLVHGRRRRDASAAHADERSLAAALDEGLDARFEGDGADSLDAVLFDLGMLEAVAARLVVRSSRGAALDRAAHLVELARLYAGPLADDARARRRAYLEALALDPDRAEASAALRALRGELAARCATVRTGDPGDAGGSRAAAGRGLDARADRGDWRRQRGLPLERLASTVASRAVGRVLLSSAAERSRTAGDAASARRLAELAVQADPASPRAVATLANVDGRGSAESDGRRRAGARHLGRRSARDVVRGARRHARCGLARRSCRSAGASACVALRPGHRPSHRAAGRPARRAPGTGAGSATRWPGCCRSRSRRRGSASPSRRRCVTWPASTSIARRSSRGGRSTCSGRSSRPCGRRCWRSRRARPTRASRRPFSSAGRPAGRKGCERVAAAPAPGGAARAPGRRRRGGAYRGARHAGGRRLAGDRSAAGPAERAPARPRRPALAAARRAPSAPPRGTPRRASWAWRDLGAALWDLAEDRVGAITAWHRAARLSEARGHATLALDLVAFAGTAFAFEYLARLVETEPDDLHAAAIAADVARAALTSGEPDLAFDLAARGPCAPPGVRRCPRLSPNEPPSARASTRPLGALRARRRTAPWDASGGARRTTGARASSSDGASTPSPSSTPRRPSTPFPPKGRRSSSWPALRSAPAIDRRRYAPSSWWPTERALGGARGVAAARREHRRRRRGGRAAQGRRSAARLGGRPQRGHHRAAARRGRGAPALRARGARSRWRSAWGARRRPSPSGSTDRKGRAWPSPSRRASLELFADAEGAMTSVERAIACDADVDEFGETSPGRASTLALAEDARGRDGQAARRRREARTPTSASPVLRCSPPSPRRWGTTICAPVRRWRRRCASPRTTSS